MIYEYNGHMLDSERILQVANEINEYFPFITREECEKSARLEGYISTEPNLEIEANRLYNIMLTIQNENKD